MSSVHSPRQPTGYWRKPIKSACLLVQCSAGRHCSAYSFESHLCARVCACACVYVCACVQPMWCTGYVLQPAAVFTPFSMVFRLAWKTIWPVFSWFKHPSSGREGLKVSNWRLETGTQECSLVPSSALFLHLLQLFWAGLQHPVPLSPSLLHSLCSEPRRCCAPTLGLF